MSQALMIAIVDDEEPIRKALSRLLRASGYRVETYASGADFLSSLEKSRPDLLVLDLHMPGLSGFEIQEAVHALDRPLPVIVVTGHDSPETRQRVIEGRAAAYLRKPIDEQLLIRAICEATGSSLPA